MKNRENSYSGGNSTVLIHTKASISGKKEKHILPVESAHLRGGFGPASPRLGSPAPSSPRGDFGVQAPSPYGRAPSPRDVRPPSPRGGFGSKVPQSPRQPSPRAASPSATRPRATPLPSANGARPRVAPPRAGGPRGGPPKAPPAQAWVEPSETESSASSVNGDNEPNLEPPICPLPRRLVEEPDLPLYDPCLSALRAVDEEAADRLQARMRLASSELRDLLGGGKVLSAVESPVKGGTRGFF